MMMSTSIEPLTASAGTAIPTSSSRGGEQLQRAGRRADDLGVAPAREVRGHLLVAGELRDRRLDEGHAEDRREDRAERADGDGL